MNQSRKARRWTAKKLIAQYESGIRDFRQADLSGLSFRGKELSGADFSGADVRSTDFSGAKLVNASFSEAHIGGTRRSLVWMIVCCVALLSLALQLSTGAGHSYEGILRTPAAFQHSWFAFEVVITCALAIFFILKSPQHERSEAGVVVSLVTLTMTISVFTTAAVSGFMASLIALAAGAWLLGSWLAAILLRYYSRPGIDLACLILIYFLAFLARISFALILYPTFTVLYPTFTADTQAGLFLSFFSVVIDLCFSGFFSCYFLTAAATTFRVNRQQPRLSPMLWVVVTFSLLVWFVFHIWLQSKLPNAFEQYISLSVGGVGLLSTIILSAHLSFPENLAKGRFPWIFQRYTSFQQADLTDADFSNSRYEQAHWRDAKFSGSPPEQFQSQYPSFQIWRSSITPFPRYWYTVPLGAELLLLSLFFVAFVVNSPFDKRPQLPTQLPPRLSINLLYNAASLRQAIPIRAVPGQSAMTDQELKDSDPRTTLFPLPRPSLNALAMSPDGEMLAVGTKSHVMLYSALSGELIRTLESSTDLERQLYFSKDGQYLIDVVYTYGDRIGPPPSQRYSQDKTELLLWAVDSGEQVNRIVQVPYRLIVLNDVAVTFGPDRVVYQQDIYTGEAVRRFPALEVVNSLIKGGSVHISSDQRTLMDLSQDVSYNSLSDGRTNKVEIWDLKTGEPLGTFDPAGIGISTVSPSGRYFAIYYSRDSTFSSEDESNPSRSRQHLFIDIWDISTQSIVHTLPTRPGFDALLMSQDDNIVIAYSQSAFQVWDIQQGKTFLFPTAMPIRTKFQYQSVAMSDDGHTISTLSSSGKTVLVWQLQ